MTERSSSNEYDGLMTDRIVTSDGHYVMIHLVHIQLQKKDTN